MYREHSAVVYIMLSVLFTAVSLAGIGASIVDTESEFALMAGLSFILALTGLYFYKKDS